MKRYIIGFIFLFFNLLTSQISVSLDNGNIREVPLFGLANSSMRYNDYEASGIEYDFGEPDFDSAALCINPHVLTFPGANPCYFDWTSGWVLPQDSIIDYVNTLDTIGEGLYYAESLDDYSDAGTVGDYFFEISNRDYEWWENADGSWNQINIGLGAFTNFIDNYGIEGTFSLNLLTSGIDTNMSMIRKGLDGWNDASDDAPQNIQVPFKYIELGNEFYLRGGGDKWIDDNNNFMYDVEEAFTTNGDKDNDGFFDPGRFEFLYPSPQSFGEKCNEYIDSLSVILPNAKFAISSKNKPNDPRSNDWTRQVLMQLNESLIDTIHLSWHEYLRFEKKEDGEGNQDTLNAEQIMAFAQFRHEDMITDSGMDPETIAALEDELNLNIKIWLTESAFRELGEKPWIFKWAQSLVNIQNYALMLRNPYVEIIMLQALNGWSSTSAINHGNQFPDNSLPPYDGEDSCSPYGRTATAFSIYFWNFISEGMTHMQELIFEDTNGDHLGVISENPFEGQDADSNQSPDSGYVYSYLLGWKLFNADESIQRALITNVAGESKTLQFNGSSGFTTNIRRISITSQNESNDPSIDQYINGDGDLTYDTSLVDFSTSLDQEIVIPAYSVVLFEEVEPLAISTPAIPGDYNLHSVYPNPFNPVTTIAYEVPNTSQVTIKIYDISGREAAQLVNSEIAQGFHTIDWNATNHASGAYFVKMVAGSFVQTRKMVLLK